VTKYFHYKIITIYTLLLHKKHAKITQTKTILLVCFMQNLPCLDKSCCCLLMLPKIVTKQAKLLIKTIPKLCKICQISSHATTHKFVQNIIFHSAYHPCKRQIEICIIHQENQSKQKPTNSPKPAITAMPKSVHKACNATPAPTENQSKIYNKRAPQKRQQKGSDEYTIIVHYSSCFPSIFRGTHLY
ncbi:unnamed protein product, partial [Vicia faba]